jgi:hypothetical protein
MALTSPYLGRIQGVLTGVLWDTVWDPPGPLS